MNARHARIASVVMGWKYHPGTEGSGHWTDEHIAIAADFWNPAEEMDHSLMVAKQLLKAGYEITLWMNKSATTIRVLRVPPGGESYVMTAFGNTAGEAIVHAVSHMIDDGEFGEEFADA